MLAHWGPGKSPLLAKRREKWGTRENKIEGEGEVKGRGEGARSTFWARRAHVGTARDYFTRGEADQAVAAVLRDWKHSRQKTGRPCVGRKGTVVCFPHPEQVAWVSTLA